MSRHSRRTSPGLRKPRSASTPVPSWWARWEAARKSETLALGETPNIAARLEGVAETDSVVISAATLRLVPEAIRLLAEGRLAIDGRRVRIKPA